MENKSKTSSPNDLEHHPDQHEITASEKIEKRLPTREQIADRAFHRWKQAGCPSGEDERHWLDAEGELQATVSSVAAGSRTSVQR